MLTRVGAHGHVRRLAQRIHEPLHAALFGETRTEALLHLGEREVASLFHRRDLRDDELGRHVRAARDGEDDDVLRLLRREGLLIRRRQLRARERREQRRLLAALEVVMLLRERIEGRAGQPRDLHAVGLELCARATSSESILGAMRMWRAFTSAGFTRSTRMM